MLNALSSGFLPEAKDILSQNRPTPIDILSAILGKLTHAISKGRSKVEKRGGGGQWWVTVFPEICPCGTRFYPQIKKRKTPHLFLILSTPTPYITYSSLCALARARILVYNSSMYKFGKNVALGIVLIGTMCLTGCFSMESAYVNATREEHILARNYGWQLFNCIPVFCGNASNNAFCPWAFFRDDVTMDKIQSRVLDYAKEHGKTAHDLTYHNYETVIFSIPLTGIAVPIPYIICYREIQLSGVMK